MKPIENRAARRDRFNRGFNEALKIANLYPSADIDPYLLAQLFAEAERLSTHGRVAYHVVQIVPTDDLVSGLMSTANFEVRPVNEAEDEDYIDDGETLSLDRHEYAEELGSYDLLIFNDSQVEEAMIDVTPMLLEDEEVDEFMVDDDEAARRADSFARWISRK